MVKINLTKQQKNAICYKLNQSLKHGGLTTKGDVYTQQVLEKLKCYRRK